MRSTVSTHCHARTTEAARAARFDARYTCIPKPTFLKTRKSTMHKLASARSTIADLHAYAQEHVLNGLMRVSVCHLELQLDERELMVSLVPVIVAAVLAVGIQLPVLLLQVHIHIPQSVLHHEFDRAVIQ